MKRKGFGKLSNLPKPFMLDNEINKSRKSKTSHSTRLHRQVVAEKMAQVLNSDKLYETQANLV